MRHKPALGRPIGWLDPRVLRHRSPKAATTPRSRGRNIGSTSPSRRAANRPDRLRRRRSGVLAGLPTPRGRCPRGWTRGAPRARRTPASTTRPRARAPQQLPRCRWLSHAAWVRPPKRPTPSARPRAVRSAGAVEGVHVAGGLIRSRSVARGRAISARPPHQRGEERFLLHQVPRGPPGSRPRRIAATQAPSRASGGDVLQVLVRTSKNDPRIAPSVRRPCWPA